MMPRTIGNPLSWSASAVSSAFGHAARVAENIGTHVDTRPPEVQTLTLGDLRMALRRGAEDMGRFRTDVVFACLIYPVIGITLVALALHGNMAQMLFPVLSGFALIGPVASVGLYEMSRRQETGEPAGWNVFGEVAGSPRFGSILALGLILLGVLGAWLLAANVIYALTLGPEPPASMMVLLDEALTTPAGWAMIVIGLGVGFLFAAFVLAISVVSFPLLLDRDVGVATAMATSLQVARRNPVPVAAWGLIVAVLLAAGSLPLLIGLLVVMPILGHATWHLYRAAVH
jgi:uncharacterized membrane protein